MRKVSQLTGSVWSKWELERDREKTSSNSYIYMVCTSNLVLGQLKWELAIEKDREKTSFMHAYFYDMGNLSSKGDIKFL